ncbi:RNA polymerase sigma factor [Alicyclobacillus cycloheptanicus]|uniref:RNA polymerase sigma-70 factor (ECF subfamily) n=1 Tax=Alicyclobacillus cycloheptanicus TaxID=1457 RepID=A0ABT9XPJ0_9BACL|nr:RNA polymerase sigma factor [Alicyclobacillus cycloheptanicus]MDQ0191626.1 RNA polymerase sigma-70 factor (ECF subfamily) [Alicyclobacillus cycloheptanicus]
MEKSLSTGSRYTGTPLRVEDCEAIQCWVEQYYSKLFAVALAILNDYYLAQDCVQESLVKAGVNRHKLRDRDKTLAWLCAIVRNECRSILRSNWRRRIKLSAEPIDLHKGDEVSPEHLEMYQVILMLPKQYREVVVLHYINELPLRDTAKILRIRENTCRVRLHRARQTLKKLLEEEGYRR